MTYLDTLMEEKGIDDYDSFTFEHDGEMHIMEYGYIRQAINSASKKEQEAIHNTLRQIDFRNGRVENYLKHLARALV
jgi:hypothetical protein